MRCFALLTGCFMVLLIGMTSCGAVQPETRPDEVTVQLKWLHQAQFAGFYVAEQQGFYEDENLAVTFKAGGMGVDIFRSVTEDGATFGVASADGIIVERANGLPVVAVATTYRINPFVLVAFEDSGINSPADFAGKKISISNSIGDVIQLHGLLSKAGVDKESVTLIPYTHDNTAFLQGEIDVLNSFSAGSLLSLYQDVGDRELNVIWPGDYGVHVYADTIFAQEELIENDPDLVLRFLRATLRGHQFAIGNPEAAVDASMQYAEVQDREVQMGMLTASVPLIHTGEDHIGWMQPDIWDDMAALIAEDGIIDDDFDIESAYTTEFLYEIYEVSP